MAMHGMDVFKLTFAVLDKATAPIRNIQHRIAGMSQASRAKLRGIGMAAAAMGSALSAAVSMIAKNAYSQRGAVETALGDLESLGFKHLKQAEDMARKVSNKWAGVTAQAFLQGTYDIQSGLEGVAEESIPEIGRITAITARAIRGVFTETASTMVKAHGVFKELYGEMDDVDFMRGLAGGVARAVKVFRTDGPQISALISNLGADGTKAGASMAEQFTAAGLAMQTLGGAQAGTAVKNLYRALPKLSDALAKVDKNLKLTDASGKLKPLVDILAWIEKQWGHEANRKFLLKSLGSEEAQSVLKLLVGRSEEFRRKQAEVVEGVESGLLPALKMAESRNKGMAERGQVAAQRWDNAWDSAGRALRRILLPALERIGELALSVQKWIDANPKLAGSLMVAATAVGVFTTALGGVVVALAVAKTAAVSTAIASMLNPVTAVIAILAALAVGVYLVIENWSSIAAFFKEMWAELLAWWDGVWGKWGDVITAAALGALGPFGMLILYGKKLITFFAGLWDKVAAAWNKGGLLAAGKALIMGLWDGLKSAWGMVDAWFRARVQLLIKPVMYLAEKLGLIDAAMPPPPADSPQASPQPSQTPPPVQPGRPVWPARPTPQAQGVDVRGGVQATIRIDAPTWMNPQVTELDKDGDMDMDIYAGHTDLVPVMP